MTAPLPAKGVLPHLGVTTIIGGEGVTLEGPNISGNRGGGIVTVNAGTTRTGVHTTATGGLAVPNNTVVPIVLNAPSVGTSWWHSGTPSKLVVPVGGTYLVCGSVDFSANGNGVRDLALSVNGALKVENIVAPTGAHCGVVLTYVIRLNAGDNVEFVLYQYSGTTLTTLDNAWVPTYSIMPL